MWSHLDSTRTIQTLPRSTYHHHCHHHGKCCGRVFSPEPEQVITHWCTTSSELEAQFIRVSYCSCFMFSFQCKIFYRAVFFLIHSNHKDTCVVQVVLCRVLRLAYWFLCFAVYNFFADVAAAVAILYCWVGVFNSVVLQTRAAAARCSSPSISGSLSAPPRFYWN